VVAAVAVAVVLVDMVVLGVQAGYPKSPPPQRVHPAVAGAVVLLVLARDLAMHRLYVNLGHDAETYQRLRSDALALLKSIARGETAIGGGNDAPTQTTSPGVAMTDGPARRLTRDSLRGF
jgi:hypothetical protein